MEMTLAEKINSEIEYVESDLPQMVQRYHGITVYSSPWFSDYSFTIGGTEYGDFQEFVDKNSVLFLDKQPKLDVISELNRRVDNSMGMDNWLGAAEELLNEPIDVAIEAYHSDPLTTVEEAVYYISKAETDEDMTNVEYDLLEQSGLASYIHEYINRIKEN